MYFVLFVNAEGIPGTLLGPAEHSECVEFVKKKMTAAQLEKWDSVIEDDGYFEPGDGSTWYILLSENLVLVGDEDEDE